MALTIAVVKETAKNERRVAASPETVKKLTQLGCDVAVEKEAGLHASFTDDAYQEAGAKIITSRSELTSHADIILSVQANDVDDATKDTLLIGLMNPHQNLDHLKNYANADIISFAMELIPRITRAQSMDVLSSQSNLAGYKAVLDASEYFTRAVPMMMTAAGTIAPAKIFVMGAGVAGLQAIATAKRLGAVVSATDVRPAAKEQVESLGGTFIAVEDEEFKQAETAGGYAKEMSPEYQKKQAALIEEHIAKQDIVITTALIPGRPAPKLISKTMVTSMKPGSVIVDLAVETGGNCELSKTGQVIDHHGITIIGHENTASRLATDSSALYAKNILNLLLLVIDKETGALKIDWSDEIIENIALTKEGKIIHPQFGGPKKEQKEAQTEKQDEEPKDE